MATPLFATEMLNELCSQFEKKYITDQQFYKASKDLSIIHNDMSLHQKAYEFYIQTKEKQHTQPKDVSYNFTTYETELFLLRDDRETYNIPLDQDLDQEGNTMSGMIYLSRPTSQQKYKHLRLMLRAVWDVQHKHPDARFDIDGNFSYDVEKINHYIRHNASEAEINLAHQEVISDYKSTARGRPRGARNKNANAGSSDNTIQVELDDIGDEQTFQEKANEYNKSRGEQQNNSNGEARKPFDPNQVGIQLDIANFVSHEQLKAKRYINEIDLIEVNNKIGLALRNYVDEQVNNIKLQQPLVVSLERRELPPVNLGVQHHNFPLLLQACNAQLRNKMRLCPWVFGPAGTGKSTAGEMVARALGLNFYTTGKLVAEHQVLGFINVTGYQSTEFRKAYELGGVFVGDEMDSWAQDAVIALNMALANEFCAFPDKTIPRHKDFIFIAAANTAGSGATIEYVARLKQDSASLDRFVYIEWPLDESLESSMVAHQDWLAYVRRVRYNVSKSGINPKPLITPRAAQFGEALLAAGMTWDNVVKATLRKGLSETQWNMIK